jgi:hypothetical protein
VNQHHIHVLVENRIEYLQPVVPGPVRHKLEIVSLADRDDLYPVYGVPGGSSDPDGNGSHGLNERDSVRSVFVSRDYLTDLVKLYADSD